MAAAALPPGIVGAQQAALPVIGFLHSGASEQNVRRVALFRKGLAEAGFVEGENVAIEFRWASGQNARLSELAAELIARQAAVIVTLSSTPAALAAKAATSTTPIFFLITDPPVELGLVSSLNRPAGNATGIVTLGVELVAKRLELLHELVPGAATVSVLLDPTHPSTKPVSAMAQAAAAKLGVQLRTLEVVTDREIEAAFLTLKRGDALLVATTPSFFVRRAQIVALAARQAVPVIYDNAEYGGLISYGANVGSLWQQAGVGVARILKGVKPTDLPVEQPTIFEMVVNMKTANALGLAVPPSILSRADEVIE
jgi:putative tryptophan/tyrosine transport system substrate-binding protein